MVAVADHRERVGAARRCVEDERAAGRRRSERVGERETPCARIAQASAPDNRERTRTAGSARRSHVCHRARAGRRAEQIGVVDVLRSVVRRRSVRRLKARGPAERAVLAHLGDRLELQRAVLNGDGAGKGPVRVVRESPGTRSSLDDVRGLRGRAAGPRTGDDAGRRVRAHQHDALGMVAPVRPCSGERDAAVDPGVPVVRARAAGVVVVVGIPSGSRLALAQIEKPRPHLAAGEIPRRASNRADLSGIADLHEAGGTALRHISVSVPDLERPGEV